MKDRYSFKMMLLPFFVLSILALSLGIERSGVDYEISYPPMEFLPPLSKPIEYNQNAEKITTLVLFDSQDFAGTDHKKTVVDALQSMRVRYDELDINDIQEINYQPYDVVIISFLDYDKFAEGIFQLTDWVEGGGKAYISIRPDPSNAFSAIYRKFGILSIVTAFEDTHGVRFNSDFIPGADGLNLGKDFLHHTSYPLQLVEAAGIHMESGDELALPILWEYNFGNGRFVVVNSDQFTTKISRGIIGAGYSLLFDTFAYPVINGSMFFIDDFPSPIPPARNELIAQEYNRDLQGFFINVWWPDLQRLTTRYDVKFTGTIIETYEDSTAPPFDPQQEDDRFGYFGGLLLDDGGEIGLHGYNHVPLCMDNSGVNKQLNYPAWPSSEAMALSMLEVFRFSNELFPENIPSTYVPASNVLCPEARLWLPRSIPEIKIISSVYLQGQQGLAYQQEFEESIDGIIELPRITSGYELSSYQFWAAINELSLHYVSSHYLHPGEITTLLSEEQSWDDYYTLLEDHIKWIEEASPGLRDMTAQEGGMAVQRFDRVVLFQGSTDNIYRIKLDNFYDEAQLMLRSTREPLSISGGELTKVASNLYLVKALSASVQIEFRE